MNNNKKKIVLAAFVLVALVQLYVPMKMIWDREKILDVGKEYKFKTAPIDPNDPFRGKYISLDFTENRIIADRAQNWEAGKRVYAILEIDDTGYAKVHSLQKDRPAKGQDFLKLNSYYVLNDRDDTSKVVINIQYPFDRFYMDEYKAPEAERVYRASAVDRTRIAYALVNVLHGEAVLKDVLIDGESITEIVKKRQAQQ